MKKWFQKWFRKKKTENQSQQPDRKNSKEPWMEIVNIVEDDDQISLEVDWNEAFVEKLKKSGYTGNTPEQIVHKYIAVLHSQLLDDFRQSPEQFQ